METVLKPDVNIVFHERYLMAQSNAVCDDTNEMKASSVTGTNGTS